MEPLPLFRGSRPSPGNTQSELYTVHNLSMSSANKLKWIKQFNLWIHCQNGPKFHYELHSHLGCSIHRSLSELPLSTNWLDHRDISFKLPITLNSITNCTRTELKIHYLSSLWYNIQMQQSRSQSINRKLIPEYWNTIPFANLSLESYFRCAIVAEIVSGNVNNGHSERSLSKPIRSY